MYNLATFFGPFFDVVSIIAITILIVSLIIKEVVRAYGAHRMGVWPAALDTIIVALLPIVGLAFVKRFIDLFSAR